MSCHNQAESSSESSQEQCSTQGASEAEHALYTCAWGWSGGVESLDCMQNHLPTCVPGSHCFCILLRVLGLRISQCSSSPENLYKMQGLTDISGQPLPFVQTLWCA